MKRLNTWLCCCLILSLCISLTSCKQNQPTNKDTEKNTVVVTKTEAHLTKDQLLNMSDLIIKGTVTQKNSVVMSNPDGTLKDKNGYQIQNQAITDYTVEIESVYKGVYKNQTIHVKTTYGDGLSPDLILYGEDDTSVLQEKLEPYELTVGKDCILLLTYSNTGYEESTGYFPTASLGYLITDENGYYSNNHTTSNITLTVDQLMETLQDKEAVK